MRQRRRCNYWYLAFNLLLGLHLTLVGDVVIAEMTRGGNPSDPFELATGLALLGPSCSIFDLILLVGVVIFAATATSNAKTSTCHANRHQDKRKYRSFFANCYALAIKWVANLPGSVVWEAGVLSLVRNRMRCAAVTTATTPTIAGRARWTTTGKASTAPQTPLSCVHRLLLVTRWVSRNWYQR